jgi:predicted ribosome quality control (RQC) complex YloA/Tae2 family protein
LAVSSSELSAVIKEIEALGRRRVAKIYQTAEKEIWLIFREEKEIRLFMDTGRETGSMFLTGRKTVFPKTAPAFAMLLRRKLTGLPLEKIEKKPSDRLAVLLFPGYRLYCRFFGPGGFLLTDGENRVIGGSAFAYKPALIAGDIFEPPQPSAQKPETAEVFGKSPSAELEKRYTESALEARRQTFLTRLRRERKKNARHLKTVASDRDKLLAFRECKKLGDTLSANFAKIPRGAKSVTLPDPATGEETEIPLAPERSAAENINLYYKKYRRYKKGIGRIEEAMREAEEREKRITETVRQINSASTPAELERFAPAPAKPQPEKTKTVRGEAGGYRRLTTAQGYEVFVGKNGIQNDRLVKESNGNDLWFHIRDFPGSHVVLKTAGKKDIPFESVIETARIALKYSSRARNGKGTVVYTAVRNVKKPKGAPPGKVLVTHEKTVSVKLD